MVKIRMKWMPWAEPHVKPLSSGMRSLTSIPVLTHLKQEILWGSCLLLSTHTDTTTCMYIYTTSNAYYIYFKNIVKVSHTKHHTILNTSARQTAYYYLEDKLSSLEKTKGPGELSIISLKLASFAGTLSSQLLVLGEITNSCFLLKHRHLSLS